MSSSSSLVVVGAGDLGCRVAHHWKRSFPEAAVYLKTKTEKADRTEAWSRMPDFHHLRAAAADGDSSTRKAANLLFCAPPADDYAASVSSAISLHWDGSGALVFTSSGGVYAENAGGDVDEESEVKRGSQYHDKILDAERATLEAGGVVLRLGGLYRMAGGAHKYWVASGKSPFASSPDGLINQIHYDDAASAVTAAMLAGQRLRGKLLLLADGVPTSRRDIAAAALNIPMFAGKAMSEFTGSGTDGKRYSVSRAGEALDGWRPVHKSFQHFASTSYKDEEEVPLMAYRNKKASL